MVFFLMIRRVDGGGEDERWNGKAIVSDEVLKVFLPRQRGNVTFSLGKVSAKSGKLNGH
jgi:hypothetical protein